MDSISIDACKWMASTVGTQRDEYREGIVEEIEQIGSEFRRSGECERWLAGLDDKTRAVINNMNIPLIDYLIRRTGYYDTGLVQLLFGAPLLGEIATSGCGVSKEKVEL